MTTRAALVSLIFLTCIAGCVSTAPDRARTDGDVARVASPPESDAAGEASQQLVSYYARVQRSLVAQGLLRTDSQAADAPYTSTHLTENFLRIALFEEYSVVSGRPIASVTESKLHRFAEPVQVSLEFQGTIPDVVSQRDRRTVSEYVTRLARASGHPMRMVPKDGNFQVIVADEPSRRALGPRLTELIPAMDPGTLGTVLNLPRSFYCIVIGYDPQDDGTYTQAVAIIRAELPDLMRASCFHEEIAQGLGLSNDSPAARPSVFNDDEEFALLTLHDEHLLRILYDQRLRPGMEAADATPIARTIAEELAAGPS
ncbi:MAG: DUF2927 domain-containing protein [Pseudomonadota bacterium]